MSDHADGRRGLEQRTLDSMRRHHIPQGTDDPELLAAGAPPLHQLPSPDPITTICRTCGLLARADIDANGHFTGHWHHHVAWHTDRPHNVEPRPEDLAQLRHTLLTERA